MALGRSRLHGMIESIVTILKWLIELIPFLRRKRLLVVDDSVADRELIRASAQDLGISCITAPSGEIAWAMIRSNQFTIVLVDYSMTGQTGWQLIHKIRDQFPKLDCWLMLGDPHNLSALEPGALAKILIKPVEGGYHEPLRAIMNL